MKINRSLAAAAALVAAGSAALVAAPEVNAQLMVRGRVLNIVPHEGSSPLSLGVSNEVTPELDLSWFFTPNIAVELIQATQRHQVTNAGAFVSSLKIDPVIFGVGLGYKF